MLAVSSEERKFIYEVLNEQIELGEAAKKIGKDRETLRKKMVNVVEGDKSLEEKYITFIEKSNKDYGYLDFTSIIQCMIQYKITQSEMARLLDISPRAISRQVAKMLKSDKTEEFKLANQAKKMAVQHLSKKTHWTLTDNEKDKVIKQIKFNEKNTVEIEIEKLEKFKEDFEMKLKEGKEIKQITKELGVTNSMAKRNILKLEELKLTRRIKNDENYER